MRVYLLTDAGREALLEDLAHGGVSSLRIGLDDDDLKVKINGESWTVPLGTLDPDAHDNHTPSTLDPAVVDRAARAAFEARAGVDADAWDRLEPGERMTWREVAESAIRSYLAGGAR